MATRSQRTSTRAYYLYVVELDQALCNGRGCLSRNGSPPVYVGQSTHPPDVRFRQHQQGYKSSKFVRDFGVRLLPRLYKSNGVFDTRVEALEAEATLAARLRKMGYCVFGGH